MLSATPARQRSTLSQSRPPPSARSQATSRATQRAIEIPELPEYQPPEAPLTAESHRQLATLLNSPYSKYLKTHFQHAAEKLTDSAGDVNEKLTDARARYERAKETRREAGDVEEDIESEEYQRLAETETKINDVTGGMEEKMRLIIDSESRFQGLQDAMTTLDREVGEALQAAFGSRQTRGQRRQRHAGDDEDGEDAEDADYEGTPEREAREANAQNPPSHRLGNALEQGSEKWNGQSLTARSVRSLFFLCTASNTDTETGTRVTTTTLASTASYTTPSSLATKYHPYHMLLHGLRIWKIPMRMKARREVRRLAVHAISESPRPQTRMTSPFKGSASH